MRVTLIPGIGYTSNGKAGRAKWEKWENLHLATSENLCTSFSWWNYRSSFTCPQKPRHSRAARTLRRTGIGSFSIETVIIKELSFAIWQQKESYYWRYLLKREQERNHLASWSFHPSSFCWVLPLATPTRKPVFIET